MSVPTIDRVPQRRQRRRTRGWRMPADAVYVGRPSRWGNPVVWSASVDQTDATEHGLVARRVTRADAAREARRIAVDGFVRMLTDPAARAASRYPDDDEIRAALAGKDLVCWCPAGQPCHADVLLVVANGGPHDPLPGTVCWCCAADADYKAHGRIWCWPCTFGDPGCGGPCAVA